MSEFEPGQLVTCDWARDGSREEAPIFILLTKPAGYGYQRADAYCIYDPTPNGWLGYTMILAMNAIIHFNPQE